MTEPLPSNLVSSRKFAGYEFDQRYFVHTAKNNITSFGHVIAEAVSNADEAISKRNRALGEPDRGSIRVTYDPDSHVLTITDDGVGLSSTELLNRLRRVGETSTSDTRRAFFHRGIREAFMAMGLSTVDSVAVMGREAVYNRAVFDPLLGMAQEVIDQPVTDDVRRSTGIPDTGTRVTIPLGRLAQPRPQQFTFPKLMEQIESCVQIRAVLQDQDRDVTFQFADATPRRARFRYPQGEDLISERTITIAGLTGTFWARLSEESLGGLGRQSRRYGILIRGQRAAYEVSLGTKLQLAPVHRQLFGELRLDGIEDEQRRADLQADEEAQLIYKADRSGLNHDHPIVAAIDTHLDEVLGPILGAVTSRQRTKTVSENVKRQLNQLAKLINDAVGLENFGHTKTSAGHVEQDVTEGTDGPTPPDSEAIPERDVDGLEFSYARVFIRAGKARSVRVWVNATDIPPGTPISVQTDRAPALRAANLSAEVVPQPDISGISQLTLTIVTNEREGRGEVTVLAGGYAATLPIHARFPRATGFIRDIVPVDQDWESGAALYDPQTGLVKVFVGRPEFIELARLANHEKQAEWQHTPYKLLVVESVREAALRTAAERLAEIAYDELSVEERQDRDAFDHLVTTEYQALDYRLRSLLINAFVLS